MPNFDLINSDTLLLLKITNPMYQWDALSSAKLGENHQKKEKVLSKYV